MNFDIKLMVFTYEKSKIYDSILGIINQVIKIVYNKSIRMIINALAPTNIIIEIIMWHYSFSNLILSDCGSAFTLKL